MGRWRDHGDQHKEGNAAAPGRDRELPRTDLMVADGGHVGGRRRDSLHRVEEKVPFHSAVQGVAAAEGEG